MKIMEDEIFNELVESVRNIYVRHIFSSSYGHVQRI